MKRINRSYANPMESDVFTYKRSIIDKIYWRLTNKALVIDAIHEKVIKKERSHI
jgi:hypothetical protein